MNYKKIFLPLFAAIALTGCTDAFQGEIDELHVEVDELSGRIEKLEQLCSRLNDNIVSIQTIIDAIQDKDYVTGVKPLDDGTGYTISFTKSETITIHHGRDGSIGADGKTPDIGLKQDSDGNWYWTLDGNWLLRDGKKVRANGEKGEKGEPGSMGVDGAQGKPGITPQLKIDEGWWFVSVDNGTSWTKLGKATGEDGAKGEDGDAFFRSVDTSSEDYVVFELTDGKTFRVPVYKPVELVFTSMESVGTELGLGAGETLPVEFEVKGGTSDIVVTITTSGSFKAYVDMISATRGVVKITCPSIYDNGVITILATDADNHYDLKVLSFYERKFSVGDVFNVGPAGGTIKIPYTANFEFEVDVKDDWVRVVKTKADSYEGNVELFVEPNDSEKTRTAMLTVYPKDNKADLLNSYTTSFEIIQASAVFSMDKTGFTVPSEGGRQSVGIESTRDFMVKTDPAEIDWLSFTLTEKEDYKYTLSVELTKNEGEERSAEIILCSPDGDEEYGIVAVRQLSPATDVKKEMVLRGSMTNLNGYKAILPIFGEVDLFIDWGDGKSAEHVTRNVASSAPISHEYDHIAKYYDIRISGSASRIDTYLLKANDLNYLRQVIQWGNLEATLISFQNCVSLEEISGDSELAFQNLTSFNDMFNGCLNLRSIPESLFKGCTNAMSFENTFANCEAIEEIPGSLFKDCNNVKSFNGTFSKCHSLSAIPDQLFLYCKNAESFNKTFSATSITQIPQNLFRSCADASSFVSVFESCTKLESIPESLFDGNPAVISFNFAFSKCISLTSLPTGLFDNNRKVEDFSYTFAYCNKIQGESPYSMIGGKKIHIYERYTLPDMFLSPTYTDCFLSVSNLTDKDEFNRQ